MELLKNQAQLQQNDATNTINTQLRQLKEYSDKIRESNELIEKLNNQIANSAKTLKDVQLLNSNLQNGNIARDQEIAQLQKNSNEYTKQLDDYSKQIQEAKNLASELQLQVQNLNKLYQEQSQQIKDVQLINSELQKETLEKARGTEQLQKELAETKKQLSAGKKDGE